jgi:flagellar protein FliL
LIHEGFFRDQPMKKIIIGLAALGLLGGGGAGAYMYFQKPAEAAVADGEHAGEADHAAAESNDSGKGDGHGEDKGPTYVKLEPMVVPILDNDGVSQVISMVVTFEVKDDPTAAEVERLKPRIKDAFIQNLYGMLNQQTAMEKGVIKVAYIKKRLTDISEKVMGENKIKDVLLQTVQQNPI